MTVTPPPPKLIKGMQADYVPAPWTGTNTSGLRLFGKNVLVMMDVCSPRTMGLVELPEEIVERMNEASESGCIAAIGPAAFRLFDDNTPWQGEKPAIGDRVYVEKYAGIKALGADGQMYRIMDYRAVAAGLAPDAGDLGKVGL